MDLALSQKPLVESRSKFPPIKKAGRDSSLEERMLWTTELEMRRRGASITNLFAKPVFEKTGAEGYRVNLVRMGGYPLGNYQKIEAWYDLDEQLTGYSVDGRKYLPLVASEVSMAKGGWQGKLVITVPLEGKGWSGTCMVRDKNFKLLFRGELKADSSNPSIEHFSFSIDPSLLKESRFFFHPSDPKNGKPIRYLGPAAIWNQKESTKDLTGESSDN